ncbi:DNA repair protein SWI5 homolog [Sycon ciliatum]|uniref:DNA repair protein SWI5 homolog n=1 Tax=Sycon ciliatum TaxID=27933 RepID=UPI0031F6FE1E
MDGRKGLPVVQSKSGNTSSKVLSPYQSPSIRSTGPPRKYPGVTPVKRYLGPPRSSFKSPVLATSRTSASGDAASATVNVEDKVRKLKAECAEARDEVAKLEQTYNVEELQVYIDLLHEYNEVKDTTQMVLGRLAEIRGTTVRQLHDAYGLRPGD